MKYKNLILLFALFTLKECLSGQSIPAASFQYDITKALDQWLAELFSIDLNTIRARESFFTAENYRIPELQYTFKQDIKPLQKTASFMDVNFYMHWKDKDGTSRLSKIIWNFSTNTINVSFDKLRITVETKLRVNRSEPGVKIFTTLNFRNFTLSAIASPTNDRNITYAISYDYYQLFNYGCYKDIDWSEESWRSETPKKTEELINEIKSALVTFLCENIRRNEDFFNTFNPIFKTYTRDKLFKKEPKNYYLIPRIPFYHFGLIGTVIKGLSNIDSLKIYNSPDLFSHSLVIKQMHGRTILDYGSAYKEAPEPLELRFRIDYLTISMRRVDCVHVKAKYYSCNSTQGALTYRQSTFLMERIESAIVSAIMPKKRVWKVCDIEMPIAKFENTGSTSKPKWEKIKEAYEDWIPFPVDEDVKIAK